MTEREDEIVGCPLLFFLFSFFLRNFFDANYDLFLLLWKFFSFLGVSFSTIYVDYTIFSVMFATDHISAKFTWHL